MFMVVLVSVVHLPLTRLATACGLVEPAVLGSNVAHEGRDDDMARCEKNTKREDNEALYVVDLANRVV